MTPPSNEDARQVGTVENGHVLTAAGWIPLRWLPSNATPPHYPGDAMHGHVFTGSEWVALPEVQSPSTPSPGQSLSQPKRRSWLPWVVGGAAIVLLVGIAVAVSESQWNNAPLATPSADTTSTPDAPAPKEAPRAKRTPKPKKSKAPAHPNRVVIDGMWVHNDMRCEYNEYTSTATGTMTNQSGTAKRYVQVSIGLYDASGALLGSALANVTNLAAGTDWKYNAVGAVARFETCKVEEVSAY